MKNTQPANDFPKLSAPAHRALANAGYTKLKQLTTVTEADFKQLHGIGPNTITALKAALAEKGLAFKTPKTTQSKTVKKS